MATQEVLTPEEEEQKKKKKKKTFADVTGVKFKDLIMPTVLGVIGSYSRPAQTAVELGLSGYRTIQAGKQVSDENRAKEAAGEYFGKRTEQLKTEQKAAGADVEDPTQSGKWLYYGQEGPSIPTPTLKDEKIGENIQQQRFRDVMMGKAQPPGADEAGMGASPIEQIEVGYQDRLPFYLKPQEQQAQGIVTGLQNQGTDLTDPNTIKQSIEDTHAKAIQDYKARVQEEQAKYDSEIRMSEMAQLLSQVNPGWAAGLMMQQEQGRISNADAVQKLLTLEGIYSKGRKEKFDLDSRLQRARHASDVELMRMRHELEDKWYVDPSGNFIIDKKNVGKDGQPIMYDSSDFAPLGQKIASMAEDKARAQYAQFVTKWATMEENSPWADLEEDSDEWFDRQGLRSQILLLEKRLGIKRKESVVPPDGEGEDAIRGKLPGLGTSEGTPLFGQGGIPPAAPYNPS
jgi:hypothetical protein